MAQSSFTQLLNPRRNPLGSMHCNSIANRLKKSLEDLDIKEAIARLPRETVGARNQSAMDLSMKHEYLPDCLQALQTPFRGNLQPMMTLEKTTAKTDRLGHAGVGSFKSMNFVQRILEEDEQYSQKNKIDFVHVLLNKKKTFVAVTDVRGNKKTGAAAGSLEGSKGRSRLSRYAAEATAEHVGRSARKIGVKSVVIKVKGSTYFRKKKKVILSWREGFRGEGVGVKSRILSIYDVTQLPHNGCRLPKQRRV